MCNVVHAVVGDEISASEEDTHLILEYELNDICGNMTAPRANRFIMHKKAVGQHHLTSLIEQFTRELLRSPPDLLVIGGLRQLLAAEASPGRFQTITDPALCTCYFLFRGPTFKWFCGLHIYKRHKHKHEHHIPPGEDTSDHILYHTHSISKKF